MGNKLKDIFSSEIPQYNGKLIFKDSEAVMRFRDALKRLGEDGIPQTIDGVVRIESYSKNGSVFQPFNTCIPTETIIGPSVEQIPVELDVDGEEHTIMFKRYQINTEVIFETVEDTVIGFRIAFNQTTERCNFTYTTNPQKAKTISELVRVYRDAVACFDKFFCLDTDEDSSDEHLEILKMRKVFENGYTFFQRTKQVEDVLQLEFDPSELETNETAQYIELLYVLLVEKKSVRSEQKLLKIEPTTPDNNPLNQLEVGQKFVMTFMSELECTVFNQTVVVHTANLVLNLIIKELVQTEDGIQKAIYGDLDSAPMYISFTAFVTEEEAIQEGELILKQKERYLDARTMSQILSQIQTTEG